MVVDLNDDDWFEPPKTIQEGIRLIITQIENINFKSYANRQILGPFDKSFTAIIGPNGSGKSNVIDSMLFVFGYRSKKLRSDKLSNLIHSSDNYINLNFCRVIVHFAIIKDEDENMEIIPGSEFTVSRTAHRDNSSYYMINDKKVVFKEVSKLLSSHGVDLIYNRFLILQGEVEQISLMKPKAENEDEAGFLEFLEDIIGSSRLKNPIENYFIQLQEANNFRSEKLNRVKAIQIEKDNLEELKNEAVLFLEKENKKVYIQNDLYQIQKLASTKIYEQSKANYDEVNELYQEEMKKVKSILDEKCKIEDQLVKLKDEYTKLILKTEEINEKFKEIERKDEEVRTKIKNNKTKGKKLCSDIQNEKERLSELEKEPENLKEEIKKLEERKIQIEDELKIAEENLNVAMNSIQDDTKSLQEEKDKQEKVLAELLKDVNVDESELKVVQSKLNFLLNNESKEKNKLLEYNSKYENLKMDIQKKESLLEVNKNNIPILRKKFQSTLNDIKLIETEKNDKIEANMYLAQKLDEAKSSRNANTSRNHVLNYLINKKNSGELKGIYGRLGDLGGIDKKYDCAISTACGQLDYIVVDTIDNATNCLKSLRENRIGSATFIALDKMELYTQYCRPLPSGTPENVPRLFDLVNVKEECVKPAFYFALRDTLVADNLDIATRIGLGKYSKNGKRWRVVTLDGKLVEISGAMTAGGRPIKGRMGTKAIMSDDNNKEIIDMQKELDKNKEEINNLQFKKKNLESEKFQLEKDLEVLNSNIPKFEQDLQIYKADLEQTLLLIKDQEKLVKNLKPDSQIKDYKQNIEVLEKKFNKSKSKSSKVEELVKELKNKIQLVIDKKFGVVKSKVDSLNKELHTINSNITKSSVAEKTNIRNLQKCKARIETLDKEIDETHLTIDNLKKEMSEFATLGLELSESYKNCKNDQETKEMEVKNLENEISKLNKQENSLNMNSVDLKYKLENHLKDLNEKENNIKKLDFKIHELKLHEIEGKINEPFKELSEENIEELNKNFLQKEIQDLDKELSQMKPNFTSIEEYRKKEEIYISRIGELNEVTEKRDKLKESYDKLKAQRLNEFKTGFQIISLKLKEMYRMITMGGDAELEWIDSLDPFTEGINFTVRPNKKSWKQMKNLSGGEKTLSSLSLIFALHYYKPSPLYFMDEIDAALDFKNVSIVANYIKQRTKNTQFIIISLRNDMYELADRLVGIYKTFNCTKSCSLDLKKMQTQEESENNIS